MARVINLTAGPGAGKSTTAAGLFHIMKLAGEKVELVLEYAKDLTYEKAWSKLENQWYVTGKQDARLRRLLGQVDWIITDSPLPISIAYARGPFGEPWFHDSVWNLFNTYDNFTVYIEREKAYQPYGRSQSEDEAREIDVRLRDLFGDRIDLVVKGDPNAPHVIYEALKAL